MNNPTARPDFTELRSIMARLRAPDGCPWDREQTHASILFCLVEETYEFLDAVERGDDRNMREELGDLLLQVVFHAQMAQERGAFNLDEVIAELSEKLVRRHPHVFADSKVESADAVDAQWESLKAIEKKARGESHGLVDGIPPGLPAIAKALKIQKRAAKVGFDFENIEQVAEKLAEETQEALTAHSEKNQDALEAEVGDVLFAAVNFARFCGVDPEQALARTNAKFIGRFAGVVQKAEAAGIPMEKAGLNQLNAWWDAMKAQEKNSDPK